jgi:arylsulfatase A-like enzyme
MLYRPADMPKACRAENPEREGEQHPFLKQKLQWLAAPNGYDEHNPLNLVTMSDLDLGQMRATYYALMTQVDAEIGRIIAHLKQSGEYDRTLIVFTCDHGEMLGDHYCWGKEIYFDSAFHIPLIVRDPRASADAGRGRQVEAFTEAVDLMPTILDWLQLETPRQCDGRSLGSFMNGTPPADWRSEVHWEHDFRDIAGQVPETALSLASDDCNYSVIRDHRFKYVHFAALPPLLFDVANDPNETRNLAGDPGYTKVTLDCAQKMLTWRLRHADRTLTGMHLTAKGVVSRR